MVNVTGQGSAIAKMDPRKPVSAGAPRVQYSTTGPNSGAAALGLKNLSDLLGHVSSRVEDRLDVIAQRDAAKEGTMAGQAGIPARLDDATIRGKAFDLAASDAISVRTDLEGREALDQYETDHKQDPAGFKSKADGFLNGYLPAIQKFDPAMAQRLEADFKLRSDAALGRIKDRQLAVIRDQQLESTLRYQLKVQDEMASDANDLFTAGPTEAQQTLTRMMTNAVKLTDSAHMIGADGTPLFSARERVAAERQAKGLVSEQIGLAWMQSQPDMIGAFKTWRDGKADMELAGDDGIIHKVPLKDILGADGYQEGTKAFMENLRGQLSLQSQIEAQQDHAFKEGSDQAFTELSVKSQQGSLGLQEVEAMKGRLEPDKYLTLRQAAKSGGATVTDGTIFSALSIDDANGQDIRERLTQSYNEGGLTRQDYLALYSQNSARINKGTSDPVSTGRDYLTQSLGSMSKEIGIAQSASIGQASAEYQIQVQSFIGREERQPTHAEARDIAESVRARYSVLSAQDGLLSLPLPRSMTQAEKLSKNLSAATIEYKVRATNKEYLDKHNGNVAERNADPEFKREILLLTDYHKILQMKETDHAAATSRQ